MKNNKGFAISTIIYSMVILFLMLMLLILLMLSTRKVILDKQKTGIINSINGTEEDAKLYKETLLNGAYPELYKGLVPVTIDNDGTVKKADTTKMWYSYENKIWANAVILFGDDIYNAGDTIKEEEIKQKIATNVFETNSESLNLDKIIIDNVGIKKSKAIVNDEEREVAFETKKQDNPNLPKGEEKVSQEGKIGKKLVNCIKTYQDDEFVDENILEEKIVEEPITQIIDVGTSEFLAKYQVHIGDKMYVTENLSLKEKPEDTSNNLCIILATLDVTLQELNDEWCKVTYESYTGYVKSSLLTSEAVTPGIGEKNRVQKIRSTLDANMSLNKPSGLTLEDFKKILSNNASDTNKIFEQNAEVFYNVEQKYNINGIFLASMAIHESGWGSSKIAKDKKNLFGFGAYDRSPYDSAVTFATYEEGIETVAKYLVKNYINEKNAKIYNNETATGTYYNGPTLVGISTRYCTDKDWPTKVYKYMNYLYERL